MTLSDGPGISVEQLPIFEELNIDTARKLGRECRIGTLTTNAITKLKLLAQLLVHAFQLVPLSLPCD